MYFDCCEVVHHMLSVDVCWKDFVYVYQSFEFDPKGGFFSFAYGYFPITSNVNVVRVDGYPEG